MRRVLIGLCLVLLACPAAAQLVTNDQHATMPEATVHGRLPGTGTGKPTNATMTSSDAASTVMVRDGSGRSQVSNPSAALDIANMGWVQGRSWKDAVRLATDVALPANTRSFNTLTATANGALTVDGVAVALNNGILVKDEAAGENNGIFCVSQIGSAGTPWIMTRCTDADSNAEMSGGPVVIVTEGTANADTAWVLTNDGTVTLNTDALVFAPISGGSSDHTTLANLAWASSGHTGTASNLAGFDGAGAAANVAQASLAQGGTGADLSAVAKGGLIVGSGAGTVGLETIGSDRQVLIADSAQTRGVRWGTATDILTAVYSSVGNVGAGEDDLMSYTVPASTLATDGDVLQADLAGTFAANGNNKRLRFKFGSTTMLDTGAVAWNAKDWSARVHIVRTGAATQRATVEFRTNDTALLYSTTDYTTPTETLSGTVALKATGEATSNDDVVQTLLVVRVGVTAASLGGALTKVAGTTVSGSAVTSVTFTGLDIATDEKYVIDMSLCNATGSSSNISLYFNNNQTATDYDREGYTANGATLSGSRASDALIGAMDASECTNIHAEIWNDAEGVPRTIADSNRGAPATIIYQTFAHVWETTGDITRIDLVGSTATSFAIGSSIIIYRVKGQ
jgi:hypothetical protein